MIISTAKKLLTSVTITSHYHTHTTKSLNNLQLSITHKSLTLTLQSHAQALSLGLSQNPFIATKLISAYAVCKRPENAKLLFDSIRIKSAFLWNNLITGYVKNHCFSDALLSFRVMCCCGEVSPDDFTFSMVLKVCGELGDGRVGDSVHGMCFKSGFLSDSIVSGSLMSIYCKCGKFIEARKVFDEMPYRNSGSWNVIIGGYALSSEGFGSDEDVWRCFIDMQIEGVKPDAFTVSSVLCLCGGDNGKWDYGRELHCYIVKNEFDTGIGSDAHLGCCLIDMYSKNSRVDLARVVFDRMVTRNVFAWTSMINSYVNNGIFDDALTLFREMLVREEVKPNKVSLLSVLPACSSLGGLMGGKQIHAYAIKNYLNRDSALGNALIDMYSKCGSLNYARKVFGDDYFCRDIIAWSSMISGYGLHGKGHQAVCLYHEMCQHRIKPDRITILGVLSACGRSGLVNEGLALYNLVINDHKIKPTLEISACIVDMLGRSGRLDEALQFIKTMPVEPGPSVWGALVSASISYGNLEMQDLAYKFLIQLEPENPSNYISMSNAYASLKKWDGVAEVRTLMNEKRIKKLPGCSWISINSTTHSFFVADKTHPRSCSIYQMLDDLKTSMKGDDYSSDILSMTEIDLC